MVDFGVVGGVVVVGGVGFVTSGFGVSVLCSSLESGVIGMVVFASGCKLNNGEFTDDLV